MKTTLINVAKVAISVGIISWLVYRAYTENQFTILFEAEKNWLGIFAGLACVFSAVIVSFVRWNLLVKAIDLPFRLVDSIRIGMIGIFFNLSPIGVIGGDALRAFYASREAKHRMAEAVATVILDRFIGLLTMVTIGAIAFICWEPDSTAISEQALLVLQQLKFVATACSLAGIGLAIGMVLLPSFRKKGWFRSLVRIKWIGPMIQRATAIVSVYRRHPKTIALCFGLSVLVNVCFTLAIFLLASSLLESYPTLIQHLMIEPIAMVGNAAPLPGGIGGMEIVMDALYRVFSPAGADNANGTVVAIGYRFFLLIVSLVGGGVWLANKKLIKKMESEIQEKGVPA